MAEDKAELFYSIKADDDQIASDFAAVEDLLLRSAMEAEDAAVVHARVDTDGVEADIAAMKSQTAEASAEMQKELEFNASIDRHAYIQSLAQIGQITQAQADVMEDTLSVAASIDDAELRAQINEVGFLVSSAMEKMDGDAQITMRAELGKMVADLRAAQEIARKTGGNMDEALKITAKISLDRMRKSLAEAEADASRSAKKIEGVFSGAMQGIRKAAIAAGAALAAAFTIRAITNSAKEAANYADQLAKTADKLQVSTEALSALRLAAKETGVETSTLDKGLQTLGVRAGEAARGNSAAIETFNRLGISIQDIAGRSPDEIFKRVADAVSAVESPTERLALAQRLLGHEGASLINTLALGSDGLERMAELSRKLGNDISRVDAKRIEDANDAIGRVQTMLRGNMTKTVAELAPLVTALANSFTEMGTSGEKSTSMIEDNMDGLIVLIDGAERGGALLAAAFRSIQGFVSMAAANAARLTEWTLKAAAAASRMSGFTGTAKWLERQAETAKMFAGELEAAHAQAMELAQQNIDITINGGVAGPGLEAGIEKAKRYAEEAAQAIEDARLKQQSMQAMTGESASGIAKFMREFVSLTLEAAQQSFDAPIKEADAAIAKLTTQLENYGKTQEQILVDTLRSAGAQESQLARIIELQTKLNDKKQETADEAARLAKAEKDAADATRKRLDMERALASAGTGEVDRNAILPPEQVTAMVRAGFENIGGPRGMQIIDQPGASATAATGVQRVEVEGMKDLIAIARDTQRATQETVATLRDGIGLRFT